MKKFLILLFVVLFTVALVTALGASDQIQKTQVINPAALFPIIPVPHVLVPDIPLPKSLDNLFPPIASAPIFLLGMLSQGEFFTSIAVDLSENDLQSAMTDFQKFKAQYVSNSKLVPEWTGFFPVYPLDSLEAALNSGNQTKAMIAYANVGQACENCHLVNMPKVQQKYHWKTLSGKDFSDITVGNNIGFIQVMLGLETNSVAIGVDLKKNQVGKAQTDFQGFNASFQLLKQTCNNCHATPRKYYVDADVQAMIDSLGKALTETPINQTKVDALNQGIGMESCFKCHLVHISGAFAQERGR